MDRELPSPEILSETARHFTVQKDDPALASLVSDARYYADPDGPDELPRGLRSAAKSLLAAYERQK